MDAARTEITDGFACLTRGDWPGAVRHLGAAVRREPGRLAVVRGLATAHVCQGDFPAARRVIGEFTLAYPLSAEGWRLLGQLEWKAGRRQEAIFVISRGLKRLPRSPVLRRQLALFRGAMGEAAAGDEVFRSAPESGGRETADWLDRVAQDPAVLEAVLRTADDRGGLAQLRELARRVEELMHEQPGHADRHLALARIQLKIGDVARAQLSVERALAINPHYAEARQMRAGLSGQGAVAMRRAA